METMESSFGENDLAAPRLLDAFGVPDIERPDPNLPYLFCGNGACRDCNVSLDGIADVPACRVPIAPGQSVCLGAGAGEANALSDKLPKPTSGPPIPADVVVVGGGPAGLASAESARAGGARVVLLEAKALPGSRFHSRTKPDGQRVSLHSPVFAAGGMLFAYHQGYRRGIESRVVVIANGASDVFPTFAGATLPGVYPMDLVERYVELGYAPASPTLCFGPESRAHWLAAELRAMGNEAFTVSSERFLIASVSVIEETRAGLLIRSVSRDPNSRGDSGEESVAGSVAIGDKRVPSLGLLEALECETFYDATSATDRVVVDECGRTSREGIFAVGDVVEEVPVAEAREAGQRTGTAAAEEVV
jgi:hypothetical protein